MEKKVVLLCDNEASLKKLVKRKSAIDLILLLFLFHLPLIKSHNFFSHHTVILKKKIKNSFIHPNQTKPTKNKNKAGSNQARLSSSMSKMLLLLFLLPLLLVFSIPNVNANHNMTTMTTRTKTEGICLATSRSYNCPVKCFTTNPVCGENGVTYWCGCEEALCAGANVAKTGFCEIGNMGTTKTQALLLVHIVWLIIVGFSVLFGLF